MRLLYWTILSTISSSLRLWNLGSCPLAKTENPALIHEAYPVIGAYHQVRYDVKKNGKEKGDRNPNQFLQVLRGSICVQAFCKKLYEVSPVSVLPSKSGKKRKSPCPMHVESPYSLTSWEGKVIDSLHAPVLSAFSTMGESRSDMSTAERQPWSSRIFTPPHFQAQELKIWKKNLCKDWIVVLQPPHWANRCGNRCIHCNKNLLQSDHKMCCQRQ